LLAAPAQLETLVAIEAHIRDYRTIHTQDLRTHIGQHHAGPRDGTYGFHLDYLEAAKRTTHVGFTIPVLAPSLHKRKRHNIASYARVPVKLAQDISDLFGRSLSNRRSLQFALPRQAHDSTKFLLRPNV